MKTFGEINKYFQFPLLVDDDLNIYVWTSNRKIAFNILTNDKDYYKTLVNKINNQDDNKLDDTFYVDGGHIIRKSDNKAILLVRGWGMLTGFGGHNLKPEYAAEIQDAFIEEVCNRLNK